MQMSNKTYDFLKFLAMKGLPALATLIITLGEIWSLEWAPAVGATVTALNAALGVMLGISSSNYQKSIDNTTE